MQVAEQARGRVRRFYAGRGFWPLWAPAGRLGPEADALVALIGTVERDGLRPRSYRPERLAELVAAARAGTPADIARAELALSTAFAALVADMRRPADVGATFLEKDLRPAKLPADTVLRAASMAPALGAYVRQIGWMSPLYVQLRRFSGANAPLRLRLNLDRARLLPGPWVRHIVVDAAAGQLAFYEGGKQQGAMRVVVGTAETPTPMLVGRVRYAILNPYWNVPTDLAQRRVAPKILAGATLASLRYEALSDWSPAATKLDASSIDWRAVASGDREIRLRQLPGPNNAMGRVKFMFPNKLGIFLHDTNERALLTRPDRHFSNGCVRLEDAPRLGRWLLGKPITGMAKRPEQDVALAEPVPIYLTYLTARAAAAKLTFVRDVYGRDGKG